MKLNKPLKQPKGNKEAHTPNTKVGMGDYYGSGIKNKVGKSRDSAMSPKSSKNLGKPPKSLA